MVLTNLESRYNLLVFKHIPYDTSLFWKRRDGAWDVNVSIVCEQITPLDFP